MDRTSEIPPPAAFPSLAAWVDAWVRGHATSYMAAPPPGGVPKEGPRVHLCASMAVDALLYPDGSIWLSEYEMLDADLGPFSFREVTGTQRTFWIALAAKRYPELRHLLPQRPDAAPDCGVCGGAGFPSVFPCQSCGGLGWLANDSSPAGDLLLAGNLLPKPPGEGR